MSTSKPNSSLDTISVTNDKEKDIEIQSSNSHLESDHESHSKNGREFAPLSMTEKGDIEAYPDGSNDPQNEAWTGGMMAKSGPVTRTSTKSSWKDPGPPPDGGWLGWTQGVCWIPLVMLCSFHQLYSWEERRQTIISPSLDIPILKFSTTPLKNSS
jgi:hypothetical protein